ncbi:MAG TPA: NADH-ubiquinone oxidoreductase-F iron-sulfur binding region domain-containing protein [Candidatus Sulfotelmatobacter sp.]|nr:NADH-ubiquinone oxidoreductase-F iron-sulfur binding region domain-containing protein [Candidatus Sulfotelmatobacter sp.]
MTTLDTATAPRLLAAWVASGRADLDAHVATHGPLPAPERNGRAFAERFVRELAESGLTGRGGAGFPTARKLDAVRGARGNPVLVVNALEGEPASQKDQALLTTVPHLVLDGAELVARAIGAHAITVAVARERPAVTGALRRALHERRGRVATTVPVEVLEAPGRFVAGEESALVHWVAGGQAKPTFRPVRGVPLSIGRRPVLVHNAESLAHAALVARHGAAWFRSAGTPATPGTALVTVTGAVGAPGVFEVPVGLPLAAVIAGAGPLGTPGALLLAGYGGTWVGAGALESPYAPESLAAMGAAMGAGVIGVLPTSACGIAETARIAAYLAAESAGQCGPCVHGLPAVAADLVELTRGSGSNATLARLRERLAAIDGRGACRHPDGAVRMIRSALVVFAADVAAHAKRRTCPAWNHRAVLPVPAHHGGEPWR